MCLITASLMRYGERNINNAGKDEAKRGAQTIHWLLLPLEIIRESTGVVNRRYAQSPLPIALQAKGNGKPPD
jgi:hypothetical protein